MVAEAGRKPECIRIPSAVLGTAMKPRACGTKGEQPGEKHGVEEEP